MIAFIPLLNCTCAATAERVTGGIMSPLGSKARELVGARIFFATTIGSNALFSPAASKWFPLIRLRCSSVICASGDQQVLQKQWRLGHKFVKFSNMI